MPQPSIGQVHVNVPLSFMSVAYIQEQDSYIAGKVFPVIPVDKPSDLYYVWPRDAFMRDVAKERALSTETSGGGYTLSTDSYICKDYGHHKDIDDRVRAASDAVLNSDRNAMQYVTNVMLQTFERNWATDYYATGKWTTDITPSPTWDDDTSDPVTDIETGKTKILTDTGFMANTLVLSYPTLVKLKRHPLVRDQYKYTNSDVVTAQLLARLFEVDRVLVPKSVQATNAEGATVATSLIHGKHALLCYSAPSPAIEMPSAGYVFAWKGVSGNLGITAAIKKYRLEQLNSDRVEGMMSWTNKVVSAQLGYFFNGAVA